MKKKQVSRINIVGKNYTTRSRMPDTNYEMKNESDYFECNNEIVSWIFYNSVNFMFHEEAFVNFEIIVVFIFLKYFMLSKLNWWVIFGMLFQICYFVFIIFVSV